MTVFSPVEQTLYAYNALYPADGSSMGTPAVFKAGVDAGTSTIFGTEPTEAPTAMI